MIIVLLSFPNLCHDSYMLQLIILSSRKYVSHVNSTSPHSHLCRGRASLTQHAPMVNGVHFVSHFAGSIGNIPRANGPAKCNANIAMVASAVDLRTITIFRWWSVVIWRTLDHRNVVSLAWAISKWPLYDLDGPRHP